MTATNVRSNFGGKCSRPTFRVTEYKVCCVKDENIMCDAV